METLNKKITENSASELTEATINLIQPIKDFVESNDYYFNKDFNIDDKKIIAGIAELSLNQRKKLKRMVNKLNHNMTLRSINLFLHFIYKKILKSAERLRVELSPKEKVIRQKRKLYLEARNVAIQLYNEYNEEKGDYFKDRIKKGQKIN